MKSEAAKLRAERDTLRKKKEELAAQLAAAGGAAAGQLRLELAAVTEGLVDLGRRLREVEPRHKISYRTTWAGVNGRAWDKLQYQSWTELESAEPTEGPTDLDLMRAALREARQAATPQQAAYLAAVEGGISPAQVARNSGRNKSTLSRTLARGRANIAKEARLRYQVRQMVDVRDGKTVLDLSIPEHLDAFLSMLTETQQRYIFLYYGEWMSLGGISDLLGVDRASVLRSIRRGLERLDEMVGPVQLLGVESLEDALIAHYGELTPAEFRARETARLGGGGKAPHQRRSQPEPGDLEAFHGVLFPGQSGGRFLAWLWEQLAQAERTAGFPLARQKRQGFFLRLVTALFRRLIGRKKEDL